MEPSADTYLTLLMGYIEKGQIEKIDNVRIDFLGFFPTIIHPKIKKKE